MDTVGIRGVWTVKERRASGLYVPVLTVKNLWTDVGLTGIASGPGGGYVSPQWLVIDSAGTTLYAQANPGDIQVQTLGRVDLAGDTQIWLSPGTGIAEKVTFSSVTSSGASFTYTLSTYPTHTHPVGDTVLREVAQGDTLTSVVTEVQYDSVNAPGLRVQIASGYSPASGQWTLQYFITGTEALVTLNTLGLADSQLVGSGALHNHFVLGYTHTAGQDIEIDGNLTMINN